jgi:hypothetical protein
LKAWLLPGDTVAVWDAPMGPRSVFAPDGSYVRAEALDRAAFMEALGAGRASEDIRPLPDGGFIAAALVSGKDRDIPYDRLYRPPFELMLISPELTKVTSLGDYGGVEQMFVDGPTRRQSVVALFSPHYQVALGKAPSRIALGNGDVYDIHVHDADGRLRLVIRRTTMSPPVTDADRDAGIGVMRAFAERQNRVEQFERLYSRIPPQERFPAHGPLQIDSDGNVWVSEFLRPTDNVSHWTIYSPDGALAGTLETPRDLTIHEIGSDYVLGVRRDENDIERVVRYALRKPG